jgi:prepilin-type N-terminal cleavage/methylation domain-containing protein
MACGGRIGVSRIAARNGAARGFTLLEMMVVLVIVGTMMAIAIRPLATQRNKTNARAARVMMSQALATTRAAAIARGCVSVLHIYTSSTPNGQMWVTSCKATTIGRATAVLDTLGKVDTISKHFGVTVSGSAETVSYDARGFSVNYTSGGYAFSGGTGARDTLTINSMGRVAQ